MGKRFLKGNKKAFLCKKQRENHRITASQSQLPEKKKQKNGIQSISEKHGLERYYRGLLKIKFKAKQAIRISLTFFLCPESLRGAGFQVCHLII